MEKLVNNDYLNSLNDEVREYFNILCSEFPSWLLEYIDTTEMKRISKISMSCGMDYSKCFDIKYFYSNLDHSVAVALIIWNLTKDKKQTLAGLFHDIATPAFKHCIDFMNGDSLIQESTEEKTFEIIKNSKEINKLLKRDNIKIEEVCDYKIYPIADNKSPRLSADRFEYNFSSGLTFFRVWDLDKIKKIYNDITVVKNEDNMDEIAFKHKEICEEYIQIVSNLWPEWISDKDRLAMQFIADTCKYMIEANYLKIDDLYRLSEKEIINIILTKSDIYIKINFIKFMKQKKTYSCDQKPINKYSTNVKSKKRYIDPLVESEPSIRISDLSNEINKIIEEYQGLSNGGNYVYYDFDFDPNNKKYVIKNN